MSKVYNPTSCPHCNWHARIPIADKDKNKKRKVKMLKAHIHKKHPEIEKLLMVGQ